MVVILVEESRFVGGDSGVMVRWMTQERVDDILMSGQIQGGSTIQVTYLHLHTGVL